MKIGNVIYEKELVNHIKVEYINYFNEQKVYNDLDKTLPTLYVGWSFMKACNPNNPVIQNADILKKRIITNELYWEFNFTESKPSHVKGVDKFAGIVPQFYFIPKYKYTNLDPVFFQLKDINDLMDVLPKKIDKLYNYKNEMIYLQKDNNIWGISLSMFSFFNFNIDEIKNSLSERTSILNIDLDGNIYQLYYRIFPNFELLKRFIITVL